MALVMEYMRTMVSNLYSPQASRKTTLPLREMSADAPFRVPDAIWLRITSSMRCRRSGAKPTCAGEELGSSAAKTSEKVRTRTSSSRMRESVSQMGKVLGFLCEVEERMEYLYPTQIVGRALMVRNRDNEFCVLPSSGLPTW